MNYRESAISGTSWVRCNHIIIENPYRMTPRISMYEQQVVTVGDQSLITPPPVPGPLVVEFSLDGTFPLLNPETGEPIMDGETPVLATHQQIYQILYSLYVHAAAERDIQAAQ